MPPPSRSSRVSVGSIVDNVRAERNAPQQYVFPRLRELCRFQAIYLLRCTTPVIGYVFGQSGNAT